MRIDAIEDYERIRGDLRPAITRAADGREVAVPCMQTLLVRRDLVVANGYNPNTVSGDKMALLRESILDNGFAFPLVTIFDAGARVFVIVDGFHRHLIAGPDWLDLPHVPIVVLDHDMTQRMSATVQFNKARGVHQVDLDAEIVRKLIEQGLDEEAVATKLGMDLESVHRYKQLTGVAALFKNAEYSMAWEMVEDPQ